MKFSSEITKRIQDDFELLIPILGERREEILEGIQTLALEHQTAMKFLYTNMPISDIGAYSFELFLSYVNHGMMLADTSEWKDSISETYFLHYILFHRCGNECVSASRQFMYEQLNGRVKGMTMKEAALEVNNWCLEMATYQPTDRRTVDPVTLCKSGYGRCGEESVLLVAALRSIGIPARQAYAPRWSHCDNNHAWVEMFCDGEWYFTGACEPTAVLNQGWFTVPASRAMMINSRVYSDIGIADDDILEKRGCSPILNNLSIYAKTTPLTVTVVDKDNQPVKGVEVRFEILNTGEFFPVACLTTNESGKVQLVTGYGCIHAQICNQDQTISTVIHTLESTDVTICYDQKEVTNTWTQFCMVAPKSEGPIFETATKEQEELQNKRNEASHAIRKKRVEAFFDMDYVNQYDSYETIKKALEGAKGNFDEIKKFLEMEIAGADLGIKEKVLSTLLVKDYTDVVADCLRDHLVHAIPFRSMYEEEMFVDYVLAPRIIYEEIVDYRSFIHNYFTKEQKERFQKQPALVWEWINEEMKTTDSKKYLVQLSHPIGLLQLKQGLELSKKVLFVAILRTIGIPAKINPLDQQAMYFENGSFVSVKDYKKEETIQKENGQINTTKEYTCKLTLHSKDTPEYFPQWTIGRKDSKGVYQTLHIEQEWVEDKMTIALQAGMYRILTVNRMTNGNLLANAIVFELFQNEEKEMELLLPEIEANDLVEEFSVADFTLVNDTNVPMQVSKLTGDEMNIFIWVEEGKEPTEHILVELLNQTEEINQTPVTINFCMKSKESLKNATLEKTVKAFNNVRILIDPTTKNIEQIAKAAKFSLAGLPFVLVTNKECSGVYAVSGYNVGTVEMLLKIVKGIA